MKSVHYVGGCNYLVIIRVVSSLHLGKVNWTKYSLNSAKFSKEARAWGSNSLKTMAPYCKKDVFKYSFFPTTAKI